MLSFFVTNFKGHAELNSFRIAAELASYKEQRNLNELSILAMITLKVWLMKAPMNKLEIKKQEEIII